MSSSVSLQDLQKVIKHLQGNDYEMIYINKQMGNEIITLINNLNLYNELLENKINKVIEYIEEEYCQIDEDNPPELMCWHSGVDEIYKILKGR